MLISIEIVCVSRNFRKANCVAMWYRMLSKVTLSFCQVAVGGFESLFEKNFAGKISMININLLKVKFAN